MLLVVGLLCGGLVSLLLLNTVLAQGSIQETTLKQQIENAKMQAAQTKLDILNKDQPGSVAKDATANGMANNKALDVLTDASKGADQVGQGR